MAVKDPEGQIDSVKDETALPLDKSPAPYKTEVDAFVERWWQEHFPGSAVARYTDAWNAAYAAKEDLKRRLKNG